MKILIVDDEKPARDRLRQLLQGDDDYEVVGEASNGRDALSLAAELEPDVVLLDIRMPGLDGIETAHHLNALERTPAVVFTTAYNEYAVDAFEARAVGYVLKPVRRSRLAAALDQASKLAGNTLRQIASQSSADTARRHVCTRSHGELKLIPISDIWCFLADQKYVRVEHEGGKDLLDDSLKSLAAEFEDRFVRIHRAALVAVDRIRKIEKITDGKHRVVLRDGSHVDDKELIISRRHVAEVRRRLKES
ncbi:MAG: response regulator [Gammaproteobacteria bacterium]|nr:response regulator [Gammaproteobacteria bacterium]MBU2675486.1 response regulator [Gammaproteobacteria bacterium]NNC57116.1 response regulator [Woeseiaceae bacterium]NNL49221.1 response regulator [Woeseiaceae bacterium]